MTPELKGLIASQKSEILRLLQESRAEVDGDEGPPLEPRQSDSEVPLSFAQQRLWFLHRLDPESCAYNLTIYKRMEGAVDHDCLERSLREVVRRHEILRSTCPEREGVPIQVVDQAPQVTLRLENLKDVPLSECDSQIRSVAEKETGHVFDFATGPMLRAVHVVCHGTHTICLTMPHIVCDGWSFAIIMNELTQVYQAFLREDPSPLPELPIQYGDYACWQQSWMQDERLEQLLAFWQGQTDGAARVLPLPSALPRPEDQQHEGALRTFEIDPTLSSSLRDLCRHERVTPFVTLLAAYSLVLARYSGEEIFLIGTPFANRRRPELEQLIGPFVNMLALRMDCTEMPTVREYLARLHGMVLDVHAHQDFPFEKLVEADNPDRNRSYTPLFQVTFVLHNTPGISEYEVTGGGSMFDLTLYVWDNPEGFKAAFEYRTKVFDEATIDRFVESFLVLAEGMVKDPDCPIARLPVLPPDDRALVAAWNDTASDYPDARGIAQCFEELARSRPDEVAVVCPGLTLTYGELDRRAGRLAHHLRGQGVDGGTRVGLYLDRSPEAVIGIIGVLKAGGVYVPLDPANPSERTAVMMADAQIRVLLTREALTATLPKHAATVVRFEDTIGPGTEGSPELGAPDTDPDALAYIMFTSGSTGRPKGVCVRHRSVLRLVKSPNYVDLSEKQTLLLYAPLSFDASTFEIWGSLLNGGRLAIAPDGALSIDELGRIIRDHGVTTLWLTAGLFHQMVDAGLEYLTSVRQLLAGGDVLSPEHVRKALKRLRNCVVINGYGPTENTTFTCCHALRSPDDVGSSVPIGKPISNTTAYILDDLDQLAPIGAIGEICTGGDGLAAGYLNDDALTRRKFVGTAFGRLYRTGDLAQYDAQGNIRFLGRSDDQMKVRGFRIEPGEIESLLAAHPGISEAVVVGTKDREGGATLVAYYRPEAPPGPPVDDLRAFLREKLPSHMIPNAFVAVESFPLTANGKVDKKALPSPNPIEPAKSNRGSDIAKDQLEIQLSAIWEQTLGVLDVGPNDNFFDLGGHSLLAVRMFSQLRRIFGRELPLATLFEAPTIAELAAVLRNEGWTPPWRLLVAIQTSGSRTPLFLVPGIGGNVLTFGHLANLLGRDQPVYGLQAQGLDGKRAPFKRIEDMAKAYVAEIRTVQAQGPYRLVGACMGGGVAFEIAQQLVAAGERVEFLALIETWMPTSLDAKRHRVTTILHPVAFVFDRLRHHLRIARGKSLRELIDFFRARWRIVREMIAQRDVYRGDRNLFYRDVVSTANYHAMAQYVPKPYPGSIQIFTAADRPIGEVHDSRLDWGELAEQGYALYTLAAENSGQLFQIPHVYSLLDKLVVALDAVGDSGTSSQDVASRDVASSAIK